MRILVTGGTGFIGSWLVKRLVQDGHQVRLLHRRGSSLDELTGIDFESSFGDVTDLESVVTAAKGVDGVFHLAGVVGYSKAMLPQMQKVNVTGTEYVIEACKKNDVRKLLHVSSVAAIGASLKPNLLNENSPFTIEHLHLGYFDTKRAAEELVRTAVKQKQIDAVIVNPSTAYGPGDAKKGSRKVQIKVAQGRFPFYPSGGASIVSIHDVVDGMLKAWQKGRSGERYILSGENLLVRDVFRKIAARAGSKPPMICLPRTVALAMGRVGDQLEKWGKKTPINVENAWVSSMYHWFDSSKAKVELGFNPRSADEALNESVDWMKENGLI